MAVLVQNTGISVFLDLSRKSACDATIEARLTWIDRCRNFIDLSACTNRIIEYGTTCDDGTP